MVISEGYVLKRNDGAYVAHLKEGGQALVRDGATFRANSLTAELTKAHRFRDGAVLAGIHSVMSDKEAWSVVPVRLTLTEIGEEVSADAR